MKTIAVTGASGFIGKELCYELLKSDYNVRAITRCKNYYDLLIHPNLEVYPIDEFSLSIDWELILSGVDTLIHCAAITSAGNSSSLQADTNFVEVNVNSTRRMAEVASKIGVKRLIFLSSIKVNGEETIIGSPFNEFSPCNPNDSYARSKYLAESDLCAVSAKYGLDVVILRLPLVYGPGVKGNFQSLIGLVTSGFPIPLASVTTNRRSLLALDNLLDLILICISHPNALNQTFFASDGEDLSTAELLRRIGKAINRPVRLFRAPKLFLFLISCVLGKRQIARRLLGSLQVDINKTRAVLNWSPSVSVDVGLNKLFK